MKKKITVKLQCCSKYKSNRNSKLKLNELKA
nr:MAG TPA: hypothetical protein [Caudoviricetes sp.]